MIFILILFWTFFYVLFGLAHGHIAKHLEYMSYSDLASASYWKEQWHTTYFMLRIFLHVSFFLVMLLFYPVLVSLALFFLSVSIGLLLFDTFVNIGRQRGINWKYLGTCEGNWDYDCFWLKIDRFIPHLLFKAVLVILSVVAYFITH